MSDNTVTMGLASYNQIKAENTRWQMFMSRLWEGAELKADYSGIECDSHLIEELIQIMYRETYKKKLATLRTQQTKASMKKLNLYERKEDVNSIESEIEM